MYDTRREARALLGLGARQRQTFHYNRPTKSPGETVRVKLPGKEHWTKETCVEALDHRSYFVKVGDNRNRRHLLKMGEPSTPEQGEDINTSRPASEENNPKSCAECARRAPVWHKDYDIRA